MTLEIWLTYVATVLVLMSSPGPSQLLMLSNSASNGFKRSLATGAGDLTANFLQMLVASVGLVGIIKQFHLFFDIVKWAGVAYLVYLGLKLILTRTPPTLDGSQSQRSIQSLYSQGFITSASNPKAVIFFSALFPQFINTAEPLLFQFFALSLTYLFIDGLFLTFYGKSAELITQKLRSSFGRYLNQACGGLLIGSAVLLGLKKMD